MITDLQKASFWKRASAFLFDIIIMMAIAAGLMALISTATGYDKYTEILDKTEQTYKAACEEKYDVNFSIEREEYEKLTEEQKGIYDTAWKEYRTMINADAEYLQTSKMVMSLILLMVSMGILISCIIVEFIVPLFFKNGQTLGKKIFGIGVVRTNSLKVSNFALLVRALFGKYVIEIMAPIFIVIMMNLQMLNVFVGIIILIGLVALEAIVFFTTKTRSPIHDLIADVAVIDMSTQMIFNSQAEKDEYASKIHEGESKII